MGDHLLQVSICVTAFLFLESRVKARILARLGGFFIIYRDVKNKEGVRLGLGVRRFRPV
jgi:hypothetical protein